MQKNKLAQRACLAIALTVATSLVAHAQDSNRPAKIGYLSDFSTAASDSSGPSSLEAVKMAIEDFGGTVLGKPVELVYIDHQSKPDVAVTRVREWVESQNVTALIDASSSAVTLASVDVARKSNTPIMVALAGSSDLTGKLCSPMTTQWVWDTYSQTKLTVAGPLQRGLKDWFLITSDYSFGNQMEKDLGTMLASAGGKLMGVAKAPLGSTDLSSYILQIQASGAKVVGIAIASGDFPPLTKQMAEFGMTQGSQARVVFTLYAHHVAALGLPALQGLEFVTPFYHDADDETRAWTKRFMARTKNRVPNIFQAGAYSATLHYLKAVKAAGTSDGPTVSAQMKKIPVDDFEMKNVTIREDGQVMRPEYFARVKSPAESKGPYDYFTITGTASPEDSWRALKDGGCPLIAK